MMIRTIAAAAVLVSAVVHLYLWFDGVKDQGTVGALFVVNVVAGIAIAVLLVMWHDWAPLLLAAGFGAATIVAFLIAATVGLFGIETDWSWYAWLAFVVELVAVVCGALGLAREGYVGGRHRAHASA
ncbi:hypothetical protein SAMN04487968_106209 [Nocardioides terrae]|uniref:Uncharacterized protein n=1 Tax=Nocardioides terrae TaxID=574651 RepID=A0A1I1J6V6_9ACTN|nr:hypothetical protein [Nocardioides terrae]SFC44274.1 hypothetical protein SAMN04487968_106209 [Nocardioides terrae]